jgi:AMMECR1 domain-containing protein
MCFFLLFLTLFCGTESGQAREVAWRESLESPVVQKQALELARRSLSHFLKTGGVLPLPTGLAPALKRRGGVIATLEKNGQVAPRGCRGTLEPMRESLGEEIIHNIISAATRDKRVKPLKLSELASCRISLSVILSVRSMQNLSQHDASRNGLIAKRGAAIGLVLPYEGRDARVRWDWARRKAGLKEGESAQMLEVEAVRFRE